MRLAIFADVHGKLLLPFKLVDLYQQQTGKKIDFILQCGDMGAYPDIHNLDKATLKHARQNRDELGFHDDFIREQPAVRQLLDRLNIDMICVRGNHEDHDFLDKLEQANTALPRFPIDIYHRVFVCRSGVKQELRKEQEVIYLAGIGRIGDAKGRTDKRFIQEYEQREVKRLLKSSGHLDILLTHDKDDSSQRGYGMRAIREVLDHVPVLYHFYGHTGEPFRQEADTNGITQSVKVSELEFGPSGILPEGCMLIIEHQSEGFSALEVVSQRLTNQLTQYNWKD
ncbi:serine/threonine protein phosphatase [Chitinophaga varians]|uniref:Serine/threonine protein phosphatase n=1 Tax=Chitinophaga varians TaxID=2202339 RepID=A0A847S5Q8_9BACT|nr:metallophosphoesterase [Chitinophaga varians]NLR68157.1 serine/threonine protein phosphatase [Chitinophaga varians]